MKKSKLFIPLLMSSLLLVGCANKGLPLPSGDGSITAPWVDYNIPMTEINFSSEETSLCLYKGETHQYQYTYAPSNATVSQLKWESDNEEVASVSESGLLTANKGGHAKISVSSEAEVPWQAKELEVEVLTRLESFDVAEESLDLDFNEEYQLNVTFNPVDASDTTLNYLSSDSSIATVINGKVTAKANEGQCTITVTSEQLLGFEEIVHVEVSDKTIHVESVAVSLSENRVEVNKSVTASAVVTPSDAKEYLDNGVTFETTTTELINIDSKTGAITAKEPGIAKIKAICEGVESPVVDLEVYEIVPHSIIIVNEQGTDISSQTINLSNLTGENTYQISHKYLDDESVEVYPSRPNVEYQSLNTDVVTVTQNGLITIQNSGETSIVVRDNRYTIGAQIHVVVTINATSVTLQTDGNVLGIGKTMTLRSSITPSNVTDGSVVYSIDSTAHATLQQESGSNIATLTGVSAGEVVVTVTTGSVHDSKTISVEKIPGTFKENTPYIVGSADFSSGTSTGSDTSWEDSDLAFEITENIVDPIYTVQKRAQITFRANDEWKVRVGSLWPENDHYERTGGNAFDAGQMVVDSETTNIKVIEAGRYDIYYKIYADTGYEAIYITKSATLSIDKTLIYLAVGSKDTITASNVAGTLHATSSNSNVSCSVSGNIINLTGNTVGNSKITISDDLHELYCDVNVTSTPVTTYKVTYYLPDSLDATQKEFSKYEVNIANGENLYASLSSAAVEINGFTFSAWHSSNEHFRSDDPDNDAIANSVTVASAMTIYAKYVKNNDLYYYHSGDNKDYYVSESFDEYGINASSVYYGTHIYSVSGVEGVEVQLGTPTGVYKLTKNASNWTILRKVGFGITDVPWWISDGRHAHIYCFDNDGNEEWVSNITFVDSVYVGFFDLSYTGFILTRSTSTTGSWEGFDNQTVDIKLDTAGISNPEIYSISHTTAFIQDSKDGSKKSYYNWW